MAAMVAELTNVLRDHLVLEAGDAVYGIVDGAQDLELAYEAKCLYGQDISSFFDGQAADALVEVAPYLVPIDRDGGYIENWVQRWGTNAGVLMIAVGDLEGLQAHLREIFIAKDENGQEYFFRYYDPRVLRSYLPTCTPEELTQFFGPIKRFLLEGDDGETLLVMERSENELAVQTLDPLG